MHRTVPGFRTLHFGDVVDLHLLDEERDNNAVHRRAARPGAGRARSASPTSRRLRFALAIAVEIGRRADQARVPPRPGRRRAGAGRGEGDRPRVPAAQGRQLDQRHLTLWPTGTAGCVLAPVGGQRRRDRRHRSTRCSSSTCSQSSPALAWRNHTRSPTRSVGRGGAGQRGLHLAGALGRRAAAARPAGTGAAAGTASAGPEAIQPPPSTVAMPGAGRRTTEQREEGGRGRPPGPVRVEQGRAVEPGAGGDLGDRRVGRGRGDAAGAAAVDELQVGVLADGGDRGAAAGQQLRQGPALHRPGSRRP